MTEVQGALGDLIARIPHPAAVLGRANGQHRTMIAALENRDGMRAVRLVRAHLAGTEQILTGLIPAA